MKFSRRHFLSLTTASFFAPARAMSAGAEVLTVFAAASLGDALKSAVKKLEQPVQLSLAGSGTIARQVSQGAPADVVILANTDWMDWLQSRSLIFPETRVAPFGNTLALIGPADAPRLERLSGEMLIDRLGPHGRLAMGEHRSVPAGQYARQWLESEDLWETVRGRLAEVENVRAAFTLVSRREAPLGLVYQSDLRADPSAVTSVWDIPDHQQPRIRYSAAAITEKGRSLVRWLASNDAAMHFLDFGFSVPTNAG